MAATLLLTALLASSGLALPHYGHYGYGRGYGRAAVLSQASLPSYRTKQPFTAFAPISRGLAISRGPASAGLRIAPGTASLVAPIVALAEQVKATLGSLPLYPGAQVYLDRVLSTSSCLSSLDEAIAIIDSAVGAVVASEPEINILVKQAAALEGTKKASVLVAGTADLVDTLAALLPALAAPALAAPLCGTRVGAEASVQELREVGRLLGEVAVLPGLQLSSGALVKSSESVYATVTFIGQLRATYAGAGECSNNPDAAKNSVLALGTTLDNVADLFGSLGNSAEAERMRVGGILIKNIVADLAPLDGLALWEVDCTKDTLAGSAANLREIAAALEDRGVQEISRELGISLDLGSLGLF